MVIELLVVPDCPNEAEARQVLRAATELAGVAAAPVTVTVIESTEEAQRRGFVGSPTFLVDGADPFAVPGAPTGLTCRVYATASGMAGVPEVEMLRDALLRA
ncbi:MAG: thioredoxin family protein [Mycobacteriales bacterium]